MNKRYKVSLTKNQWCLVTTAMYEYAGVCDQDSDNNDGTVDRNLYELAKALYELSSEIGVRVEKQVKNEK